jgi:hypothetical protein
VRVTTMEGGAIDAGTEADSITGDHTTVVIDELR